MVWQESELGLVVFYLCPRELWCLDSVYSSSLLILRQSFSMVLPEHGLHAHSWEWYTLTCTDCSNGYKEEQPMRGWTLELHFRACERTLYLSNNCQLKMFWKTKKKSQMSTHCCWMWKYNLLVNLSWNRELKHEHNTVLSYDFTLSYAITPSWYASGSIYSRFLLPRSNSSSCGHTW